MNFSNRNQINIYLNEIKKLELNITYDIEQKQQLKYLQNL